jgi:uncharacterized lipoprotein YajG
MFIKKIDMKKILVLVVSSLVLFSCAQEEKKVEIVPVVSDEQLMKACDSLLFGGNTKIKIKLENVTFEGQPIDVDGECVLSLSVEK